MRLGCCGPVDQADAIKAAGFEFLEVNIQAVLQGQEDDAAWSAGAPDPDKLALPIEAANSLLPGSLPIVGPARDLKTLEQYMDRVACRAQKLGIQRLVLGSGKARIRPDDVPYGVAFDQVAEFARMAADACAKYDVLLVLEHLRQAETNMFNSLVDSLRLYRKVNHPAFAMLVDSYHYGLEEETDQALLDLEGTLQHVHVAEPVGRIQPGGHGDSPDAFDFETFFTLLHKIGYDQRISFEGKWSNSLEQDGAACVEFLRSLWVQTAAAD